TSSSGARNSVQPSNVATSRVDPPAMRRAYPSHLSVERGSRTSQGRFSPISRPVPGMGGSGRVYSTAEVAVHTRVASPPDRVFFPLMALTALAVVAAGFAPTYYLGFWFGAPPLQAIVHVHAMAFTAWLLLLLSQTLLIRLRKVRWHRAMGKLAAGVVVVMVITGYMVIVGKPRPTPFTRAFIFTPMLSLLLFPVLFGLAIRFRRDPATHKRLMLLATIAIANAGV